MKWFFVQMKLNKFAYLYSKPLGNHTLKILKKIRGNLLKKPGKIMEISWNFVSPKKWEPCSKDAEINLKQESIPVGCVPPACRLWGWGPGMCVSVVCVSKGCMLPPHRPRGRHPAPRPRSRHPLPRPRGRHPPPVDRMTDTRLWKYYLAPN